MTEIDQTNLTLVHEYLAALERGEVGDALARFFTDDAVQVEFPNRLNPRGQQSDLATMLARSVQGQHVLASQRYEILREVAQGEHVAVEARWVGTFAIALGGLAAGSEMKAHFAMFFEFREGRIARQHNYDCFEPW